MPKMDGIEATKEILSLNRKRRLAFAPAHVETFKDPSGELGRVETLQKPFETKELIELVDNE